MRIAIVGGSEVRAAFEARVETIVDESPSGSQNLLRALRAWPEDGEPLIYATSDLPYVSGAAVALSFCCAEMETKLLAKTAAETRQRTDFFMLQSEARTKI